MTVPQLLDVGSKLIGLYLLAASVPILLSMTVGWLFSNPWEQMDGSPQRSISLSLSSAWLFTCSLGGH